VDTTYTDSLGHTIVEKKCIVNTAADCGKKGDCNPADCDQPCCSDKKQCTNKEMKKECCEKK